MTAFKINLAVFFRMGREAKSYSKGRTQGFVIIVCWGEYYDLAEKKQCAAGADYIQRRLIMMHL